MDNQDKFFIVSKKALPEVLLKVVEVNRILETDKGITVQDAADRAGLSRSSYYKYKDDIVPFKDTARGKTITFVMQMDDQPGILSMVLNEIAKYKANILMINQSMAINGIAPVTLSVEILPSTVDVMVMVDAVESIQGVHSLKILARE